MKIAICGATGMIGSALTNHLKKDGHVVMAVSREDLSGKTALLGKKLDGIDGLVNLAGAPVLKKWSAQRKSLIYQSRVETTSFLVSTINRMKRPPSVFISASAVGIYDALEIHDEYSTDYAGDFLSEVCVDWESEALKVDKDKVRLVILRQGVVLSRNGGILKKMIPLFMCGLGGKIGDGFQVMPYIHLEDLLRAIEWILLTPRLQGVFNMVAPQLVSNDEFTQKLAEKIHRPAFFSVPVWFLKTMFGEGADVLIKGQKVVPSRLQGEGFRFNYPDLETALTHLLA